MRWAIWMPREEAQNVMAQGAKVGNQNAKRHGYWRTPTYRSWEKMIQRCYNENGENFIYYGGRGVTVCESWRKSFVAFLDDMGECPPNLTLDRKDPTGNYDPGNCRWASWEQQHKNTRARWEQDHIDTRFLSLKPSHFLETGA